jgi:hypothetical protein
MATPSKLNVFRVPGKLILSPTNSTAPNYGGTVLGAINRVQFDTGIRYVRHYFSELGKTGEVSAVQKDALFRFALRGWDDDSLAAFFPSYSAGVVNIGGGQGPLAATKAKRLLYAPDRPSEHPGVLLLNAVPMIDANEQSLRFSILFEFNIYISFLCLPAAVSDPTCAKIGLVSNLL